MAVQPWELAPETTYDRRPNLELVPAPPRGGRVIPAVVFVALLLGAIGYPTIRAATAPGPAPIRWSPRPASLAMVDSLDLVRPITGGTRPTSREPLGGILFVRCTNIWTALPDGSHARKLLEFPGISTATFSPDARTVAFVAPRAGAQRLFMVGADGAGLTEIGAVQSDGDPVGAQVTNLVWSPRGDQLSFALVDAAHDPWTGGSTIWTLNGPTGGFARIGAGWPSPALVDGRAAYAAWITRKDERGPSFTGFGPARHSTKSLSSPAADLTFGAIPTSLSDSWATRHGAAVLRDDGFGTLELAVKRNSWQKKVVATYAAPPPHSFFDQGRISLSQDSRFATVDLIDPADERDLGILDLESGKWTVLDYAWSGSASPAPTATGPVRARRIARLTGDLFETWGPRGPYSAAMLLADDPDDLIEGRRGGYIVGSPVKTDRGWSVSGTIYRRHEGRYRYQNVIARFTRTDDRRLEAQATPTSKPRPLETIADAKRFLADVMGDERFAWPSYIPEDAKLNPRWPVDAYSWDGDMTATAHLVLPRIEGQRQRKSVNISFGDVSFSLGCGGENNPEEQAIGEAPGLFDHIGSGEWTTRQVLWPATMEAPDTGFYSVYGEMPRATLLRIAESMS